MFITALFLAAKHQVTHPKAHEQMEGSLQVWCIRTTDLYSSIIKMKLCHLPASSLNSIFLQAKQASLARTSSHVFSHTWNLGERGVGKKTGTIGGIERRKWVWEKITEGKYDQKLCVLRIYQNKTLLKTTMGADHLNKGNSKSVWKLKSTSMILINK